MKIARSSVLAFAGVGAAASSLLLLLQLTDCGSGDDNTAPSEAGSTDTTSSDVSANDSTSSTDGPSANDGNRGGQDGGGDSAGQNDGSSESGSQQDAGGADGDASACPVAVPSLDSFVSTLVSAACQQFEQCCLLSPSEFNMALCTSFYSKGGAWLGLGFVEPYFDGGRIAYDPTAACNCLVGTSGFNCGSLTGQDFTNLQATCFAAVHGTATDGGACASSYECAPGLYCAQPAADAGDAGLGLCQPLVPDGGPCTTDFACSYLQNGQPELYCNSSTQTCAPRVDVDGGCTRNPMCTSNRCVYFSSGSLCQAGGITTDPGVPGGFCDALTIKDAGGGG